MTAMDGPQSRTVGLEPVQTQEVLRRLLLPRLGLTTGPVRHGLLRLKPMAITGAGSRVVDTDSRQGLELAFAIMARARDRSAIRRRIKKTSLERG
jgi:hypothetical protein